MAVPPVVVHIVSSPLKLPPGELWCAGCGLDVPSHRYLKDGDADNAGCPRCGSQALVPAVQVLHPDEYYVAN